MQPNVVDLRYLKLWIPVDQIIYVSNIKGLHYQVAAMSVLEYKFTGNQDKKKQKKCICKFLDFDLHDNFAKKIILC